MSGAPEAPEHASGSTNPHGSRHAAGAQKVMGLQQFFLNHYSVHPLPTGHRVEKKEHRSWEAPPSRGNEVQRGWVRQPRLHGWLVAQ